MLQKIIDASLLEPGQKLQSANGQIGRWITGAPRILLVTKVKRTYVMCKQINGEQHEAYPLSFRTVESMYRLRDSAFTPCYIKPVKPNPQKQLVFDD